MKNLLATAGALPFINSLNGECIDLTLFSPPYDNLRVYENGSAFDVVEVGKALYNVTKDGGMCAVVIQDGTKNFAKSMTSFELAVDWTRLVGWRLFECCIYQRHGNPGAWWSKRFRVDHEYVFLFLKGKRPRFFSKKHMMVPAKHAGKVFSGTDRMTDGSMKVITPKQVAKTKCRGTVWFYPASNTERNVLKKQHPATFPDALARDIIRTFTRRGDVVLDPMMGSGTTPVVAAQLGRKYLGSDISAEYVRIAKRRMKREVGEECLS